MFTASSLMAEHGVNAVFSDRGGGCSPYPFERLNLGYDLGDDTDNIDENLRLLCAQANLVTPHQVHQVHGVQVFHAQGKGARHHLEADILLAVNKGVGLAVRTADCLPILLADPKNQVACAVHAGWRGTAAQVASIAVKEMVKLGAKPANIMASLGACIEACCFEINGEIARKLRDACGQDVSLVRQGLMFADLKQANRLQLQRCGLRDEHIETSNHCTYCCSSPTFFSYRKTHGVTGRQLAIISL